MNENEVRWGVIGAGDVVMRKSGGPLGGLENSRWVALTRRNRGAAEEVAARFGVSRIHADAADLIGDPEVNAVYVATPPSTHAAFAIAALEAGKNVYLEKPMALDAREAETVLDAARRSGSRLVMAHYRRALPAFLKVGEFLADGAVGEVRFARIRILQPGAAESSIIADTTDGWRLDPSISGGGLFHDLAPHQLDLCLHWFGEAVSVSGVSRCLAGGPADDYAAARIEFASGVRLDGLWAFCVDSPDRAADEFEIFGSRGRIRFSFFGERVVLERDGTIETLEFELPEWIQEPMLARTVDFFLGRGSNPCPGEAGRDTMKIIDAVALSSGESS